MIELYHNPISTCSQKVRICLAEKGLAYESRVIDFARREQLSDGYLKINPNGVVPALVHDGQPIIDSSVICEYLDEVWPEPALSPASATERAAMRAWMRFLEEVPTAAIRVPSYNRLFAKSLATLSDDAFTEMTEKMPLRKAFYRKLDGANGFDQNLYEESIDKLESTLVRAEKALAESEWIVGDEFSIADIVLIPTAVRMDDIGLSEMWSERPNFTRWYNEVISRPSFDIAYFHGSRINVETYDLKLEA